jgi:mRNA interferase MazF
MGQYACGDVLLASVALDDRAQKKTRPVIVIRSGDSGLLHICPVSSKPPSDAPCLPLTIDDFSSGGLDLFSESYIMTSHVLTLAGSAVIGKKGRLTKESLAEVIRQAGELLVQGTGTRGSSSDSRGRRTR